MERRIMNELNILMKIIVKTVPVEKIYLLQSAQENPLEDSDLGIYVVMSDQTKLRELEAMKLIHKAIGAKKTRGLDVIVGKKNKFDQLKFTPGVEQQLWQRGQVLYG